MQLVDAPHVKITKIYFKLTKLCFSSCRLLFPNDESLASDLLRLSGVEPTKRAHQLSMDDFDSLCLAFLELCNKHDVSRTPMKVNKPRPIACSADDNKML